MPNAISNFSITGCSQEKERGIELQKKKNRYRICIP